MNDSLYQQLIPQLAGLAGAGLGYAGSNASYNTALNGLNTMAPTQLGNFSLNSGAGTGSYNLANGTGSVGYGSLNPAFSGLASLAGAGASGYNTALIPGLTNTANGTLGSSLSALNGAYSGNANYQQLAAEQAAGLGSTYNQIYGNTLSGLQAEQAPGVQQHAFGLQNTLFGSGVLNSTGGASGAIAAGNFGSQVNAMNAQDALTAQQQALSGMTTQAGVANELSGTGNSLLSNAFNTFGGTNSLISGLNTANLNNAATATQGAGAIGTLGLNNYNAGLQTALSAAQARNGSLFSYAMGLNGLNQMANPMSNLGSLLGNSNLSSALLGSGSTPGLLSDLGSGISSLGSTIGNYFSGSGGSPYSSYSTPISFSDPTSYLSSDFANMSVPSFGGDGSDF